MARFSAGVGRVANGTSWHSRNLKPNSLCHGHLRGGEGVSLFEHVVGGRDHGEQWSMSWVEQEQRERGEVGGRDYENDLSAN